MKSNITIKGRVTGGPQSGTSAELGVITLHDTNQKGKDNGSKKHGK